MATSLKEDELAEKGNRKSRGKRGGLVIGHTPDSSSDCGYGQWELHIWAIQNLRTSLISYRLNV